MPTVPRHLINPEAPANCAYPWFADQGDGTYRNPVLHADYSDPDVMRHGDEFFMVASSFNCTPGLPVLRSMDLVNWTLINHAVENLPHARYAEVQPGCGIWAPAIRFHAGKFWIFFPTPDEGIYVTTADHPSGQWSAPRLVQEGKGLIDPCPLWDDDGQAYLVHAYASSRSGIKHILRVRPMAPDGSRLLSEGRIVFQEPERHPTIEGPKFLKRNGWYYILAPAGGVESGWQVALRSRNVFGPYEDRIVLEQGSTPINGPHQGALVEAPGGDWWFAHFQDVGLYGRVTHLQPVRWTDDWPLMGVDHDGNGVGEPVLHHTKPRLADGPRVAPQATDEFESAPLGRQWQWQANHSHDWYSLTARPGWLRLFPRFDAHENLTQLPHLLLQKFPARSFVAETLMEFNSRQNGEEAGLAVVGETYATLALEHQAGGPQIVLRVNGSQRFAQETPVNTVKFRVSVNDRGECVFSFATDDNLFVTVPQTYVARKGVWIGAKLGLYSLKRRREGPAGHVDVDCFRFAPL